MTDLATLSLKVDSSQVAAASRDLDRFQQSGRGAEAAAARMATSWRGLLLTARD